jgi:hypothetical protein
MGNLPDFVKNAITFVVVVGMLVGIMWFTRGSRRNKGE